MTDPRITPARPDVAAAHLKGHVEAARFAEGAVYQVSAGVACVRKTPTADGRLESQCLYGDRFTVYEETDGFGWGQAERDGYVGYVDMACLSAPALAPTHQVKALRTYLFSDADLKSAPHFLLSLNALVPVAAIDGSWAKCARGGFIYAAHLDPLGTTEADFVAVAERFLHAPYQWGGVESLGLDCSGLIQMALWRVGAPCPRDSDMQEAALGAPVAVQEDLSGLQRGDLVFWKGHVGVMVDAVRILHANAHHMAVAIEPLQTMAARVQAHAGPIRSIKRL